MNPCCKSSQQTSLLLYICEGVCVQNNNKRWSLNKAISTQNKNINVASCLKITNLKKNQLKTEQTTNQKRGCIEEIQLVKSKK